MKTFTQALSYLFATTSLFYSSLTNAQVLRPSQLNSDYSRVYEELSDAGCVKNITIRTERHSAGNYPKFYVDVIRFGGESSSDAVANCAAELEQNSSERLIINPANTAFKLTVEVFLRTKPNPVGSYRGRADDGRSCSFTVSEGAFQGEYIVKSSWGLLAGKSWTVSEFGEALRNSRSDDIWLTLSTQTGPSHLRLSGKATGITVQKAGVAGLNNVDHCIVR